MKLLTYLQNKFNRQIRAAKTVVINPITASIGLMPIKTIMLLFLTMLNIFSKLLSPLILKHLVESGINLKNQGEFKNVEDKSLFSLNEYSIYSLIYLWVFVWLISAISRNLIPYVKTDVISKSTEILTNNIVDRVNAIPLDIYQEQNSGQFMSGISNAPMVIERVLTLSLDITEACLEIVPTIYAVSRNNNFAMLSGSVIFNFLLRLYFSGKLNLIKKDWYRDYEKFSTNLVSALKNHEYILLDNSQAHEGNISRLHYSRVVQHATQYNKLNYSSFMLEDVINGAGLLLLNLALIKSSGENLQAGNITQANFTYQQLTALVSRITSGVSNFSNYAVDVMKIDDIFSLQRMASKNSHHYDCNGNNKLGVKLTHLSFFADRTNRKLLSNIDLSISPGKITAIVGASGSGKSTIARIIAGLYDHKNIKGIEYVLEDKRYCSIGNRNISLIPADPQLFENRSIFDNIFYNVKAGQVSPKKFLEIINVCELTAVVKDIDQAKEKTIAGLSTGEKKRIALARGLVKPFDMLILDEPTSGLDEKNRDKIIANILQHSKGKTILIITHDRSVQQLANHVVEINSGEVVKSYSETPGYSHL